VDDAFLVRVLDRVADLREEFEAIASREVAQFDVANERAPIDELHREPMLAVVRRAGAVQRGDALVRQAREHLDFALEQFQRRFTDPTCAAHDLERHATA